MDPKQTSKPSLIRKNSTRKAPEIRQTLTSKYRMLKANPLMLLDDANTETSDWALKAKMSFCGLTLPTGCNGNSVHTSRIDTNPRFNSIQNYKKTPAVDQSGSRPLASNRAGCSKERKIDFIKRNIKASASNAKILTTAKNDVKQFPKSNLTKNLPSSTAISGKNAATCSKPNAALSKKTEMKAPIRRSLSAQHFNAKKKRSSSASRENFLTRSSDDIRKLPAATIQLPEVSPIVEEINFKTPSAYKRRSILMKTPQTENRSKSVPRLSTPAYYNDLQRKLNDWLKKRGKSIGDFNHLKCFGINADLEENKENIETEIPNVDSFEDLRIIRERNQIIDEVPAVDGLETIAKDALQDLHKLISEDYPREQCEAWLELMNKKFPYLEEEPQYWECRAAIEQARGNITSAVECFKTAIIQGAEIKAVDESLDQLLQKFSLLNINMNQKESRKDRTRIIEDARNVFKSSIIQFAVRERSLKKKNNGIEEQKTFIATPVRRSTRISKTGYTSTPGIKIYSTLKEIDSPIRNCIDFKCNSALSHV